MDEQTIELETLKQSIHKSAEKRESAKLNSEEQSKKDKSKGRRTLKLESLLRSTELPNIMEEDNESQSAISSSHYQRYRARMGDQLSQSSRNL